MMLIDLNKSHGLMKVQSLYHRHMGQEVILLLNLEKVVTHRNQRDSNFKWWDMDKLLQRKVHLCLHKTAQKQEWKVLLIN